MKWWRFCICIMLFSSVSSLTAHAMVNGYVTDTQGNPVRGAQIIYYNASNPGGFSRTFSNSSGWYEFDPSVYVAETEPEPFSLGQNYPNPFNPSTTIPFTLDTSGHITLTIYSVMGQKVCTLIDEHRNAGSYSVVWDAKDDMGNHVGSGVYLYRMVSNRRSSVRKMLLLDGGGISATGSIGTFDQHSAKQTAVKSTIYNIEVRRIGYNDYFQASVGVGESTRFDVTLVPSYQFVSIPGGTCLLGDIEGSGNVLMLPVHEETVVGFEMSRYEITNAQYVMYLNAALRSVDIILMPAGMLNVISMDVYGNSGDGTGQIYLDIGLGRGENGCWIAYNGMNFFYEPAHENRPVVGVSWYGAKAFALYYGYDLPTETEWEYACRGGKQYMYGTDDGTIGVGKANYNIMIGYPVDVWSYPANPFGLYNMSGNVVEWCDNLFGNIQINTQNAKDISNARVAHGGCYSTEELFCRASYREPGSQTTCSELLGFRVVHRP